MSTDTCSSICGVAIFLSWASREMEQGGFHLWRKLNATPAALASLTVQVSLNKLD